VRALARLEPDVQFVFVVNHPVSVLPFEISGYEHGQQQSECQQSDNHHVGRHVAHVAEYPAIDGRQDKADKLRAAVQQSAGRAFRNRVRQLDGQLVTDRKVSSHEQPVRARHVMNS